MANPLIRRGVHILLDLMCISDLLKTGFFWIMWLCVCVCGTRAQPSPWIAAVSCHGPFTSGTHDCLPSVSLSGAPLPFTYDPAKYLHLTAHIFHKNTLHFKGMHTQTRTQLLVSVFACTWEDLSNPMPQYQIAIWWENVWRKEECRYIWLLVKCAPLCVWERSHGANRACLNVF